MKEFKMNVTTIIIAVVVVTITIVGCDLPFEQEPDTRDFLIRKGEHYASPRLMETFGEQSLKFRATFDASARYTLDDPAMQSNKNKLMGFSDCNGFHHENSARFGWQWSNDNLEIYAYCYVDSMRVEKYLGTVAIDEENLYEIVIGEKDYTFFMNGEPKGSIIRSTDCTRGVNYMLYPYFGGSVPAPHDVRIKIEMLH